MSTSKLDTSGVFQPVTVKTQKTCLTLSSDKVRVCKSGVEFISAGPIPAWKEMTVDLHSPSGGKVHCTGVVVGCQGDRHSGYVISVLFMNLSRQAQTHLSDLVISRLA